MMFLGVCLLSSISPVVVRREVEVVVSSQALKVLANTSYSVDDFIDFCLTTNRISFGGHNAAIFLERMYDLERDD